MDILFGGDNKGVLYGELLTADTVGRQLLLITFANMFTQHNISSLIFAFNDCCLHKDGFLKAPLPEDPPPTEIEETTRTRAVGGAEPAESGQERHFFPLRGACLP